MSVRPLTYWPESILNEATSKVNFGDETTALSHDLVDSMFAWGGIGLAAPQVGEKQNIFVISQELDEGGELIKWVGETSEYKGGWVFINPAIIRVHPGEQVVDVEGCLSFPNIFLKLPRYQDIVVQAYNCAGEQFSITAKGLLARAIQHEYDHLQGLTMLDSFGRLKREMVTKRIKKWRKRHGVG